MSDLTAGLYPEAMSRRLVQDAAVIGAAIGIALGLTLPFGRPWIDFLFVAVIVAAAAMGARVALRAVRAATDDRRNAAALANASSSALVAAALEEERVRLADDIDASLRASLRRIVLLSDPDRELRGDEREAVRAIHAEAREATSELRRRLGLLRTPSAVAADAPVLTPSSSGWVDVILGGAAAAVALAEAIAYPLIEGWDRGPIAIVLTVIAAASVAVWRLAPAAGALVCACCYLAAALLGTSVVSGFWTILVVGLLIGRLCAVGSGWRDALAAAALLAAIPVATVQTDPENAAMTTAIAGAAMVGGLVVRLARAAGRAARSRAAARRGEVQPLVDDAITAERAAVARELHDTVSHAIGVIAMQAAAGEVSWPSRPERSRDSIRLIHDTAQAALDELDAGLRTPTESPGDLETLVARIRETGTLVQVDGPMSLPRGLEAIAYRVVQEALTNALRHAPGCPVRIEIAVRDGMLSLGVEDEGTRAAGEAARGYGLTGVAERVALAGGRLVTGPGRSGRGFRLEATIPVPQVQPA